MPVEVAWTQLPQLPSTEWGPNRCEMSPLWTSPERRGTSLAASATSIVDVAVANSCMISRLYVPCGGQITHAPLRCSSVKKCTDTPLFWKKKTKNQGRFLRWFHTMFHGQGWSSIPSSPSVLPPEFPWFLSFRSGASVLSLRRSRPNPLAYADHATANLGFTYLATPERSKKYKKKWHINNIE